MSNSGPGRGSRIRRSVPEMWQADKAMDYDTIGRTYTSTRAEDPRIRAAIWGALGEVESLVNVGAGTGSYEPPQTVLAVEPSATMIAQRADGAAPVVQGVAEALPLPDGAVDAALAVLTIHHWSAVDQGLAELRRVSRRRIVILHWDHDVLESMWLTEYFPLVLARDRKRWVSIEAVCDALGGRSRVEVLPIPHDCADGFAAAFWRRPEAYLNPAVRAGISCLAPYEDEIAPGIARLRDDLAGGAWHRRHADLLALDALDCGYRLIVCDVAVADGD